MIDIYWLIEFQKFLIIRKIMFCCIKVYIIDIYVNWQSFNNVRLIKNVWMMSDCGCWEGSQSQEDYVELVAERPIIRKMQDNMVVKSDAKLIDKSIQHADFPQFQPKRPIIAKLTDNLKIEGLIIYNVKLTSLKLVILMRNLNWI